MTDIPASQATTDPPLSLKTEHAHSIADTVSRRNGVKGRSASRGAIQRRAIHLMETPASHDLRDSIRKKCAFHAATLDRDHAPSLAQLESVARDILKTAGEPEKFIGWTMVVFASEFWRDQVAAAPMSRRLLLLPSSLTHTCQDASGHGRFELANAKCDACKIAELRVTAEELGYKVLVAEGSSQVLKMIVNGNVDAVVGVASLRELEKAIDRILLAGIPCVAAPLLSNDSSNPSLDDAWIEELIHLTRRPFEARTRTYVHLMRLARGMFQRDELNRLTRELRGDADGAARELQRDAPAPNRNLPNRESAASVDPIVATERIAYDFLAQGGKHSRPFVTLAVYDALTGSYCTGRDGAQRTSDIPDAVRRAALSIETFHKASLVHDDIEDDDAFRYGLPTVHRVHGTPAAINIGDYLIGLGYRLVSRDARVIGPDVAADILDRLADAHLRLSKGQGAELAWRDARDKRLTTADALDIYALKTAPAFEAAMYSGIRLAGPAEAYEPAIKEFARHLGVAFQILNDLKDWQEDADNKLTVGADVLGGRPTFLLALALEQLSDADQSRLHWLIAQGAASADVVRKVRALYVQAGVFETANQLVTSLQTQSRAVADQLSPIELSRLANYLIESILQRSHESMPRPDDCASESMT